MKIEILLCDTFPGLLPPCIPSYESMFMKLFDSVEENITYQVFKTYEGELPPLHPTPGTDPVLYLITGCNLGAYDDIPWIHDLMDWVRRADRLRVKLTGICFGHQLIAQALGGKVEKAGQGWGTGIRESILCDSQAGEFFPEGRMRLMYNHHDQVIALPERARKVATSEFCPVESFRIGDHILTFQGHPEYVPEYNRHLIENFAADESPAVKSRALDSLRTMTHQGRTVARWLLSWTR